MKKRVLVTGGSGFVGSHLCDRLIKDGYYVICLDNLLTSDGSNIKHLIGNENFVLETDSPYLSPDPNRGQRNDSRNIKYVASKMAELKNITYEEVLEITSQNGKKFYGIN